MLLLFSHCKLVRAGLFQVPTSYTVQREKGLIPTRESSIPCPLTLLPSPHGHRDPPDEALQEIQAPQLQWDSKALQIPCQGSPRAALFPSFYLPDNGTIQQVLNVLMGFRIASVAHLPQGHFTPPWEPGVTAKKKAPVVCCINCLMTECSR